MLDAVCHKQGCQDVYIIFITIHSDAPAARFDAASQRFKRFKSCFAAFKVQGDARRALHAEGFTRAVGALPAPQVLYTRFSALNA